MFCFKPCVKPLGNSMEKTLKTFKVWLYHFIFIQNIFHFFLGYFFPKSTLKGTFQYGINTISSPTEVGG